MDHQGQKQLNLRTTFHGVITFHYIDLIDKKINWIKLQQTKMISSKRENIKIQFNINFEIPVSVEKEISIKK